MVNKSRIATRLLTILRKDQQLRKRQWKIWRKLGEKHQSNSKEYKVKMQALRKELLLLDTQNTNTLKRVVTRYGWLSSTLIGKRGAQAAWLLVQHADHDLSFQKSCLKLMQQNVRPSFADLQHIAFLTDRIRVHENKKQIYGTQFKTTKAGKLKPFPIANKKGLEARLHLMHLKPFTEYKKEMEILYK